MTVNGGLTTDNWRLATGDWRLTTRPLEGLDPTSGLGAVWERLVGENPASGIMQSLVWAEFKRRLGFRTLHLGLFAGERLVGGLLAYTGPVGPGAGLLVAPEGPVLPWADAGLARAGLRALLARPRRTRRPWRR